MNMTKEWLLIYLAHRIQLPIPNSHKFNKLIYYLNFLSNNTVQILILIFFSIFLGQLNLRSGQIIELKARPDGIKKKVVRI